MTTTVEVNRSGTFEAIDYEDFSITAGTSASKVAPTATVTTTVRETITAGQEIRIIIDGTTAFDGVTKSGGKKQQSGLRRVQCEHEGVGLMDESVTFSETSPTDAVVLQGALDASDRGAAFTLSYNTTAVQLNEDYSAEGRTVKRVFRDMMDRAGRTWWIDPASKVINVGAIGGRGTWQVLDAETDRVGVVQFDEGTVETVRNDVEVVGTGDVAINGTASDATSISEYGRRTGDSPYNVAYATTQSEVDDIAQALLQADPLAAGEILVHRAVGDVVQPLVNYTVDLTDGPKDIDETGLVVQEQTIEQGRATLKIGQASGLGTEQINRQSKSNSDVTEPGSVVDTSRIADDSVDSNQLVDASVIEAKLDDASVATAKIQNNAVVNGSLADLSVSETKIQDGSISTPKLIAGAVTANEIAADTITAAQIAAGTITALEIAADTITANEIASRTITALEIATDTLTANEIDVLDLDTDELTIADSTSTAAIEFDSGSDGVLGDFVRLLPSSGTNVFLGSSADPLARTRSQQLLWNSGVAGSNATLNDLVTDATVFGHGDPFLIVSSYTGGTNIRPEVDNSCELGTVAEAFETVYSHNYVTASPDEIDAVSPDEVRDADWYDNPPESVRQRAREIGDTDDEIPNGIDHTPVDLGTMANWLLETCKAQQQQIDDLADRVDLLEGQN